MPDELPDDPFDSRLRQDLLHGLRRLAAADVDDLAQVLGTIASDELQFRGPHPINEQHGLQDVVREALAPLKRALPDLERRDDVFIAGRFEGRDYVAAMGHYCGTFENPWLGIPPTGHPLFVRYGEVHRIERGRITQSTCVWDLLDVMHQAGFAPVAASLGLEARWPGPLTADGVRLSPSPAEQGRDSLQQTLGMHAALGAFDDRGNLSRETLMAMPQRTFWHPKMMWYGPSGIGTTRALSGFVDRHQLPFRLAFPGRKGGGQWDDIVDKKAAMGGGHYIRIGDGPYSITSGWPSVHALHEGGGFLGLAPSGREVGMRVMDFYLHDEGLIRENWVPIDIIDVLLQLGVDVFDRMQLAFARGA